MQAQIILLFNTDELFSVNRFGKNGSVEILRK